MAASGHHKDSKMDTKHTQSKDWRVDAKTLIDDYKSSDSFKLSDDAIGVGTYHSNELKTFLEKASENNLSDFIKLLNKQSRLLEVQPSAHLVTPPTPHEKDFETFLKKIKSKCMENLEKEYEKKIGDEKNTSWKVNTLRMFDEYLKSNPTSLAAVDLKILKMLATTSNENSPTDFLAKFWETRAKYKTLIDAEDEIAIPFKLIETLMNKIIPKEKAVQEIALTKMEKSEKTASGQKASGGAGPSRATSPNKEQTTTEKVLAKSSLGLFKGEAKVLPDPQPNLKEKYLQVVRDARAALVRESKGAKDITKGLYKDDAWKTIIGAVLKEYIPRVSFLSNKTHGQKANDLLKLLKDKNININDFKNEITRTQEKVLSKVTKDRTRETGDFYAALCVISDEIPQLIKEKAELEKQKQDKTAAPTPAKKT